MRHKHYLILIALCYSHLAHSQASGFRSFQTAIDHAKQLPTTEAIVALDSLVLEAKTKNSLDTLALIHHTKGVKWYREDLEQSIVSTREAIQIRESLKDTVGLVQSHFNVARFLDMRGEYYEAVQHFERVVDLGFGPKNKQFVNACINLGRLERDRGDYQRALRFLILGESALLSLPDLNSRDSLGLANVYHTAGTVHNAMRDPEALNLGIKNFEKAAPLFSSLGSQNGLAACYEEWGNALVLMEKYPEAIHYFEKARAIHQTRNAATQMADLGNNLSIAYKRQGDYNKAKAVLQQSIKILNEEFGAKAHPEKASKFDNLAEVYLAQGQFEMALDNFQKAIANHLTSFQPIGINDLPSHEMLETSTNKEALLVYLSDKARAWQAYYDQSREGGYLVQALETLLLSDYLIDLMRSELLERSSQLFWREKVHRIYESALNICYRLEEQEKAFYFLEKSKSILLLESLVNADARKVIPDSLADEERAMQREILELNRQLEENPDSQQLRQALLAEQKASREFIARIKNTFSRYYNIRYEPAVNSLADLQSFLTGDQHLLVHYFYGTDYVFIMPVAKTKSALIRLDNNESLQQNIQSFINQFQSAATILHRPKTYTDLAFKVYQNLLAPALEPFSRNNFAKITLIMDGPLNYLPADALLYEMPSNIVLGNLPYLYRQFELGYAYSATILLRQHESTEISASRPKKILGLAPFVGNNRHSNLPELAYSKAELDGVQKKAKGDFLFGDKASQNAFMAKSPLYDIIHLSTHASANSSVSPPYIAFSDQNIYLPQLYAMELPIELVVLSACETGLGTIQQGEGVMSLARGFTYAGASSLISSLWRVNDQATATLFIAFYEQLLAGNSRNEALRAAKLAYLQNPEVADEEKSPYYWAGFVFIGADKPLALSPASSKWKIGLTAFVILAGLFFILIIQRNFRSTRRR